jgi:hypothetical protein
MIYLDALVILISVDNVLLNLALNFKRKPMWWLTTFAFHLLSFMNIFSITVGKTSETKTAFKVFVYLTWIGYLQLYFLLQYLFFKFFLTKKHKTILIILQLVLLCIQLSLTSIIFSSKPGENEQDQKVFSYLVHVLDEAGHAVMLGLDIAGGIMFMTSFNNRRGRSKAINNLFWKIFILQILVNLSDLIYLFQHVYILDDSVCYKYKVVIFNIKFFIENLILQHLRQQYVVSIANGNG